MSLEDGGRKEKRVDVLLQAGHPFKKLYTVYKSDFIGSVLPVGQLGDEKMAVLPIKQTKMMEDVKMIRVGCFPREAGSCRVPLPADVLIEAIKKQC